MSKISECHIGNSMPVMLCEDELPFAFGKYEDSSDLPEAVLVDVKPVKKSVRFREDPTVHTFMENRADKVVPKKSMGFEPGDISVFKSKMGPNSYHSNDEKILLLESKIYNMQLGEPFDKPLANYIVKRLRKENYFLLSDPIGFVTTELLLGSSKISEFPTEVVEECVENIKHILKEVEELNSSYVVDYIQTLSISHLPNKDQRPIVKKKLKEIETAIE